MPCRGPVRDLRGIEIEAGDSFEYNVVVGGEVSFKRGMGLFVDLRYLAAELNGDQIFVIDDVSGTAQSVTFDLGGTQGAIGFGYRF